MELLGTTHGDLVKLHPPSRGWIAIDDCVTMDCEYLRWDSNCSLARAQPIERCLNPCADSGPKHVLMFDVDGTLTGLGSGTTIQGRSE
eukprot:2134251-Prymnesium_polylepis.1